MKKEEDIDGIARGVEKKIWGYWCICSFK